MISYGRLWIYHHNILLWVESEKFSDVALFHFQFLDSFLEPRNEYGDPRHIVRLLSPIMTLPGGELENCLTFMYFSRYMDISLYVYDEITADEYLKVGKQGTDLCSITHGTYTEMSLLASERVNSICLNEFMSTYDHTDKINLLKILKHKPFA